MKKSEVLATREKARQILADAGFTLTCAEAADIEVIDCGLNQLATEGLELVTYINTDRYCAKELVIFPGQTCPEHRHPPIDGDPGKQETFRCRRGLVWLYVEGTPSTTFQATVPKGSEPYYTVFHEITLRPGDQYTVPPNTRHWFQAGLEGAVVSEFSSPNRDELDVFTDPRIHRTPIIED